MAAAPPRSGRSNPSPLERALLPALETGLDGVGLRLDPLFRMGDRAGRQETREPRGAMTARGLGIRQ
jgi:hypothetical protein